MSQYQRNNEPVEVRVVRDPIRLRHILIPFLIMFIFCACVGVAAIAIFSYGR